MFILLLDASAEWIREAYSSQNVLTQQKACKHFEVQSRFQDTSEDINVRISMIEKTVFRRFPQTILLSG